jgi:cytochrome c oxidase cbb3-type subunit III
MEVSMKHVWRYRALAFLFIAVVAVAEVKVADGAWLGKVPGKDREKANPFHDQEDAAAAGKRLFTDHCAPCHGKEALGDKKHPSLRTERVQQRATDGELHWLISNGDMARGMPSWSKLGDPQIWQIVTYVKTLH